MARPRSSVGSLNGCALQSQRPLHGTPLRMMGMTIYFRRYRAFKAAAIRANDAMMALLVSQRIAQATLRELNLEDRYLP